ncbi:MAG TPA: hypothetical protein VGI33_02185 [Paenibacillus sp.]|jgi:hypothetical protein
MPTNDLNKNSSKGNPFASKPSNTSKIGNPFNLKIQNEDASEGIKREFFERKNELSEQESNNKNNE